jgi:hypothetical protein
MEESDNGKESPNSAHANGMKGINVPISTLALILPLNVI